MKNVSTAPPYKQLFGFASVRAAGRSPFLLYETISLSLDYQIECWDDSQYLLHLRPLVHEEDWMQLKKDILQIYFEQNAKRAALRKLIQFNSYRSMFCMFEAVFFTAVRFYMGCYQCVIKHDPLRDRQCTFRRCLCIPPHFLVLIMIMLIWFLFSIVFLALDLLTYSRFDIFDSCHRAFLEAVMTAHPDLDPVLVEEELIQKLRQLADDFMSRHPGVYCRFTSVLLKHYGHETFQIQFLKFVPDFQV